MTRKKNRPAAGSGSSSRQVQNGNGSDRSQGAGTTDRIEEDRIEYVSISQETRRRYLNYAMSVITSRALPDVRDGLKPVQRRILYVMYHGLHLTADGKTRKSAKICGDTIANFHPHGESAVYDAMVRMAQNFSLRIPLVHGQGNFGSVMGLPPAAPRYTEAKLTSSAEQLMSELRSQTVETRPNYDATQTEPVVLPARYPNLLVNGTQGIAVGMATSIPPHNPGEVIKACVHLIHHSDVTVPQLMKFIKGPDFPLGGRIVTDRSGLTTAYKQGRGPIKVRGEWKKDTARRKDAQNRLVIYSVPYGVSTGPLVAEIGEIVVGRKLPQLVDVNDETDEQHGLQIVLELKPDSDPEAVMAYLYRNTQLEQNFSLNTTCLVPSEQGALVPRQCSLGEMLRYFLDFRFATVRRRFEFQLRQLERKIHILEGFEIVFDGLDRALNIIRSSTGKPDAAAKLMAAFPLDEVQTTAILDLALYRISRLEIGRIRDELKEKRAAAEKIRQILASDKRLWKIVEQELQEVAAELDGVRRTKLGSSNEIAEFDPQTYIIRENTNVVVTREGWLKRVGRLQKVESTRVREGDSVLNVAPGSTLDRVVLFSSDGVAYTLPIDQIPHSTGYGEPLSKHVRLADGTTLVQAISTDPRFTPQDRKVRGQPTPSPWLLIVTAQGQVMRLSLSLFRATSTRTGRKYCRLRSADRVVFVERTADAKTMFLATRQARVLHCRIREVPILAAAGKGVRGIRLEPGDEVLGAVQLARPSDCLRVINTNDKPLSFGQMKYGVTSRGGKGIRTSQRNGFREVVHAPIQLVNWDEVSEE